MTYEERTDYTNKLYRIVLAKLTSSPDMTNEKWIKMLEEKGIVRHTVGFGPPTIQQPFFRIEDPLTTVSIMDFSRQVKLNLHFLYIPAELAEKILVLGDLP